MDNVLITGSDVQFITQRINWLSIHFDNRHLGPLKHFLGIDFIKTPTRYSLSQKTYIESLLQKAGMDSCKISPTLVVSKNRFNSNDNLYYDLTFYRCLVRALQYLTVTRPDIAFAVNTVCQHMHEPRNSHFQAVKRILRYLKGTIQLTPKFTSGSLALNAYSDSDWAGDITDRKSTSGFCVFFGNNPIMWL